MGAALQASCTALHLACPLRQPPSCLLSRLCLASATVLCCCLMLLSCQAQANKISEHGEILLGGLFPIHQKGTNSTSCGPINKDRGIQRLEAMLFAIDKINHDAQLLKNIKLGAIILDTCSSDTYALNQSLEFIRASINTVEASAFECSDGAMPRSKYGWKHITGVVGGSYSEVSLQVANLLRLFKIPQVSYASTGTSLSDKTRYDFFARTVPPDTYQALALVDLVQMFNWSYVSLVTSEGQYGDSGLNAFTREAKKRSICIAMSEKVPQNGDRYAFQSIVWNLHSKPGARGVVLFLRAEDNRGILEAVEQLNLTKHFTFVASDGWGRQDKLVHGVEMAAQGALTLELANKEIAEFDDYISNLTIEHSRRNPWFKEYWRDTFSCRFADDPLESINFSVPLCSPHDRINPSIGYAQETKVQFVVDAVYSFAYALQNAWTALCQPYEGYCDKLKELDGESFYKHYLLNVEFEDLSGNDMKFDKNGDGLGRYNIYNFQRLDSQWQYKQIGQWSEDGFQLQPDQLAFSVEMTDHDSELRDILGPDGVSRTIRVPDSVCSKPCKIGQIKIVQQNDRCCWICSPCKPYEFVYNESHCEDCGEGRWPYPDKQSCYDLQLRYMQWGSALAIVPIVISLLGILLTSFVILIFVRYSDTPIVKASGRELSFILLGGIMGCYLNTFFLIAKPTLVSCTVQRFCVGFTFSVIYAALLTKTNRISRIFDSARKTARRPSFISPRSQVIITICLVMVQVGGTLVWYLVEPPGVRKYFPDGKRSEVILKCRVRDASTLLSLAYNMILITTCTLYAVKTRKIPENFNESKFIGFTMYTTCIIWLAFVPIYFGTGNNFEIQVTTLCISISLSAYVALFCLFSPKIYIILFHPDKNVRKLTMNSATYKKATTTSSSAPTTSSNHGNDGTPPPPPAVPLPVRPSHSVQPLPLTDTARPLSSTSSSSSSLTPARMSHSLGEHVKLTDDPVHVFACINTTSASACVAATVTALASAVVSVASVNKEGEVFTTTEMSPDRGHHQQHQQAHQVAACLVAATTATATATAGADGSQMVKHQVIHASNANMHSHGHGRQHHHHHGARHPPSSLGYATSGQSSSKAGSPSSCSSSASSACSSDNANAKNCNAQLTPL